MLFKFAGGLGGVDINPCKLWRLLLNYVYMYSHFFIFVLSSSPRDCRWVGAENFDEAGGRDGAGFWPGRRGTLGDIY